MRTMKVRHIPTPARKSLKRLCPMRLTSKCGNWNCSNAKKRYVQAYLYHAKHLHLVRAEFRGTL